MSDRTKLIKGPDRRRADFEAWNRWIRDPEVNRYLEVRHTPKVRAEFANPWKMYYIMVDHRHVGNIFFHIEDHRYGVAGIGIMVGEPSVRGMGVGTSAIRQATRRLFAEEDWVNVIEAKCYAPNVASRMAFQKAGFTVEGRLRDRCAVDMDGSALPCDSYVMSILRSEVEHP